MTVAKTLILVLLSYSLSYLLTPLTVPLCRAMGAFDIPDGYRKINTAAIPRLGGLGFFFAATLVLFPLAGEDASIAATLAGGAVLVAGGVMDDTFSAPASVKLVLQLAAALVTVSILGTPESFSFFGIFTLPLNGVFGLVFTVFRMIFTMNAVNFADGLDGLASGLSITALLSLAVFGMINSNTYPAIAALVLAAAVLGFLPYNRYHASLFMGDCGSQFLGLAIAVLSLGAAPGDSFTFETSLFLAVPTLDTAFSVVRRLAKGKSPFVADKGHIHHLLIGAGLSHPNAVRILVTLSGVIALLTLLCQL
ncbi:MAG: undecaprenyl/decaprenyl-phosphate alpha-N-acetylglucosaminyl 1-phosphate transferase [Ruminococcaceae bacterium]|nr:undecaprenyl/decaprenyl-phosphate alpha-N-acetylglucosaminyl 1-phosphate transferase [Oscillospiraceae bacterium]